VQGNAKGEGHYEKECLHETLVGHWSNSSNASYRRLLLHIKKDGAKKFRCVRFAENGRTCSGYRKPTAWNEEANCCIKNELNKPLLPFGNEKLHVV